MKDADVIKVLIIQSGLHVLFCSSCNNELNEDCQYLHRVTCFLILSHNMWSECVESFSIAAAQTVVLAVIHITGLYKCICLNILLVSKYAIDPGQFTSISAEFPLL